MNSRSKPVTPTPQPLINDEERAWRIEIVDEAVRLNTEHGYRIDARCRTLCDAFIKGEMEMDELRFEVIQPYLH